MNENDFNGLIDRIKNNSQFLTEISGYETLSRNQINSLLNALKDNKSVTTFSIGIVQDVDSVILESIGEMLKENSFLKKIRIESLQVTYSNDAFSRFFENLQKNSTLSSISFGISLTSQIAGHHGIPFQFRDAIAEFLKKNTTLKHFAMANRGGSCCDSSGMIGEALQQAENSNLLTLEYKGFNHFYRGAPEIGKALKNNKNLRIKSLIFDESKIANSIDEIVEALQSNQNLKKLSLASCKMTGRAVYKLIEAFKTMDHLKYIDLSQAGKKESHLLPKLFEILTNNDKTMIKSLIVNECRLFTDEAGAEKISNFFEKNETLKVLKMSHCWLNDDLLEIMFRKSLKCQIQELDLSNNYLGPKTALLFSQRLPNFASLQILDLSRNSDIGQTGITFFAEFLENSDSKLQSLIMGSTGLTDDAIKKMCESLKKHKKIEFLNVDNNRFISEIGMKYLWELLEQNTSLKTISLVHNRLSMEVVESLMHSLKKNTTIQNIFTYTHNVWPILTKKMNREFKHNYSLECLFGCWGEGGGHRKLVMERNKIFRQMADFQNTSMFVGHRPSFLDSKTFQDLAIVFLS